MDVAPLAAGMRHSWIGFWTRVPAGASLLLNRLNAAPCLLFMGGGDISGTWVNRGGDLPDHGTSGEIRFESPDDAPQIFRGHSVRGCDYFTLVIPPLDADQVAASEGVPALGRLRHVLVRDDPEIQWCMKHIASRLPHDEAYAGHADEASRRLVLRLVQLAGGGRPDWHRDGSMFDRRTLHDLVAYIDAHLKIEPSVIDLSMRVGLSPSHFAKKFRLSTGVSLHRFVTRRRVQASLESLKDHAQPIAHVAFDLGFSSQSHFTRLFTELTGMTPAKYRKQVQQPRG